MGGPHRGRLRPSDVSPQSDARGGWEADMSRTTGQKYYRNTATGETSWEVPQGGGLKGNPTPPRGETPVRAHAPVPRVVTPPNYSPGEGSSVGDADPNCDAETWSRGSCWSYASGQKLDCICEICTCGKHHCPLHVQKPKYDGIATMYQRDYPWRDPGAREKRAFDPGLLKTPYDKNHFQTTNGNVYTEHPVGAKIHRPKTAPLVQTKFAGNSTYRQEYAPKDTVVVRKPKEIIYPPNIPFEHKSTHQTTYTPHDGETRRAIIPFNKTLPNTPFTGNSTYRVSYQTPEGGGNQRRVNTETFNRMPDDRDFISTKQFAYTKPPLRICPAEKLPKKAPSRHTGHCHYHKSMMFGSDGLPKATYVPYK